eukprot:CAMPEP_0185793988 /NCGR_PEP_ID=MMETSP1174-20130828/159770_1 /TAXON_ID=35687 /ORGANISM="Dictyocha speculum, Strain CCMP1381" /LENGTH=35 /DNA_ID= /DNA_START= /DNA_END= /DNA_ORIENTATION=
MGDLLLNECTILDYTDFTRLRSCQPLLRMDTTTPT